jgi:DNA polymerase I-like protein with 3'-5' exonuclease and polymerase domains
MRQQPIFTPRSDWTPPETLPDLSSAERIAVDLETKDPDLKLSGPGWATGNGHITGIAIATDNWSGYLPIRHEGGGNLDVDLVLRWLNKTLSGRADKIFHNALYDVGWLKREGVTIQGKIHDTVIAAPLVDEHRRRYSLDSLGADYCDETKDETLLNDAASSWGIDPKSEMYVLPAKYVGEYAEQDAVLTLKLWDVLQKKLIDENLQSIYELESSLIPLLVEMRWKGVRVDISKAEESVQTLRKQERDCIKQIKYKYGVDVDVWASASVARAFDKAGLTYPRTQKTNAPSFTGKWLESLNHGLPKLIVEARKYQKIRSAFIENMVLEHAHKGRIHGQMHPLRGDSGGTVSGRFSYSTPNLQQVPARDPVLGPLVRGLFLPEEEHSWGAFDYSQQEPRLTVHYASRMKLPGSEEAVSAYKEDDADFHQIVADMAGIARKDAKVINLSLSYGMGKTKLIQALGINDLEADALFNNYHSKVPFIKELTLSCSRKAENVGYIKTLLGRKCRFDMYEPRNEKNTPLPFEQAYEEYGANLRRAYTYRAFNRLIQGSAADMTKQAMLDMWKEGIVPHIQVHDELDVSVLNKQESRKIVEIMENCVDLAVPSKVDAEIGETWGTAVVDHNKYWSK